MSNKYLVSDRAPLASKKPQKSDFDSLVRLNKYIAQCGLASRRHADELIENGQVIVNGRKVYELGIRIDPKKDKVRVKGKPIEPESGHVYLIFNKPKHVLTAMSDPEGRPAANPVRRILNASSLHIELVEYSE